MNSRIIRILSAIAPMAALAIPFTSSAATPPALLRWSAAPMSAYTYWYDPNGGRYVFMSDAAVTSWYPDAASRVTETPVAELAAIPLKGTMSHKPGRRLVKFASSPRVYTVSRYGMLRWLTTENVAAALYGEGWSSAVDELSVADFPVYRFGSPVTDEAEYDRGDYLLGSPTPSQNIPPTKLPESFDATIALASDRSAALVGQAVTLTATVTNPQTAWQNLTIRFYDPSEQVVKTCKGSVACSFTFNAAGPLGNQSFTARVFNEFDQAVTSKPTNIFIANPQ